MFWPARAKIENQTVYSGDGEKAGEFSPDNLPHGGVQ
jgi:hypothetical protein